MIFAFRENEKNRFRFNPSSYMQTISEWKKTQFIIKAFSRVSVDKF
jgi:hypothetical protein